MLHKYIKTAHSWRISALFFISLILFSAFTPLATIYVESLQSADGSEALMSGKQPSPLESKVPEGTINPLTHKPYKKGDVIREKAQGAVTQAAKETAVTQDPIKAYQDNQERKSKEKPQILEDKEIIGKRTADSRTYKNSHGGETKRIFSQPVNYKKDGTWQVIEGTLKNDDTYNRAEANRLSTLPLLVGNDKFTKKAIRQDDGFLNLNFKTLGEDNTSINLTANRSGILGIKPLDTNKKVNPSIQKSEDGTQFVQYLNAWPNTDLYYEQHDQSLKEYIKLNNPNTPTDFKFKVEGATLNLNKDTSNKPDGTITATLPDKTTFLIPALSLSSMKSGPISNPKINYKLSGNTLTISLDKAWFASQPKDSFPLVIDPSYAYSYNTSYHTGIQGGDGGQFIAYKSDGYVCNSTNCDMNVGTLNDRGAKTWRTSFRLPVNDVYGKPVVWANIYSRIVTRPYAWPGFAGSRPYNATWANCMGFNCISGAPRASGNIDGDGNLNATALMQWFSSNNVGDAWLTMWAANEGDINSFKALSGGNTFLDVVYQWTVDHPNQPAPLPTLSAPAKDAVVVVNRPTLKANPVSDPDGDLVRYAFRIKDSKGNIVAYSPELDTPSWTVPDNILVDSEKYTWNVWVMERNASDPSRIETGWRPADETRTLTVDLRLDKDKTQSYDEMGPVNVNLNTGNLYTHNSSHTSSALGGDIGLGFDYNSPALSKRGLKGSYYNYNEGGSGYAIVNDPNVDMDWGSGSPFPGVLPTDNFSVSWSGVFVAPQTGMYTFGSNTDGNIYMHHTNADYSTTVLFDNSCCEMKWGTSNVSLKKGDIYPFYMWYEHKSGNAHAQVKVRTPDGAEQVVPSEWLRNDTYTQDNTNLGLSAKFYKNTDPSANPSFTINDKTPLVYATNVPQVSIDWAAGSLVPVDPANQYSDNMIINYNGYVTIPVTGDYQFGGTSDDGLRIRLGGKQVVSHSIGTSFSSLLHFDAGQIVPIQIDYYEAGGAANVNLQWKGPAGNGIIPGQYLASSAQVIPGGWKLSIDPTGHIPYESLSTKANGDVNLIDSTGFVHEYIWNGNGYKPPVNSDGYLIRNSDSTYTLTDADGRVYIFSAEGVITLITSPADDKKPIALKYEYQNTSSSAYTALPKLSKIVDGVDPSRYGQLYYWGELGAESICTVQTGFTQPPTGSLCAFKTFPDGAVTKLHYTLGDYANAVELARIEKPGNALMDYSYIFGRMEKIRDAAANDAIMAGLRSKSEGSEVTQIMRDGLLRVSSVLAPAPFGATVPTGQSNTRPKHTYEYGYQSTAKHIIGIPEPKGYSQYIEYDDLYRTTKSCDNVAACNSTKWDPVKDLLLSSTDATGMMSTIIYDEDDRAIEEYNNAPVAWFGTDRRPLAAYSSQVPKSTTSYDEGLNGPAVAWYGARGDSLFGAPKLHSHAIDSVDKTHIGRDFVPAGGVPITTDATTPGYGFSATGKIKFPAAGLYTFNIKHDDGVRLFVDDKLILDNKWKTRTAGSTQNSDEATFNAEAGKLYRIRLDYIHFDDGSGPGAIDTWLRGPSITDISGTGLGTNKFGAMMTPAYGLVTSTSNTDSALGTTTIKTTYQDPAYGLASSNTLDPTGLNYKGSATYEAQGVGYLRQTSKTLPGGNKTSYTYYSSTASVDNPCTTTVDSASQAGRLRLQTEPDPDGTGPQTSRQTESVYDSTGRVVATRINLDPWTCTTYDARGRVTKVIVPDIKNSAGVVTRSGSTVTNSYAVGGNPFISSSTDSAAGTITNEVDLLGRTIRSVDTFGQTSTYIFDTMGRATTTNSPVGAETLTYDSYSRPTTYKLNNLTYAIVTYDAYSRMSNIQYPQSKNAAGAVLKLEQFKRDTRQRSTGAVFRFTDTTAFDETLSLSSTGLVLSSTDKLNTTQATSAYTYDKASRLTQAIVDNMKYNYDFSTPTATTCSQAGANLNAHKNTNRTKFTATDTTTGAITSNATYCYNQADQLISSSDTQIGTPTYDDHGNTISLSGGGTPITFTYNNLDQNTAISQGGNKVVYVKASDGTILRKKVYKNSVLVNSYRYLDGGRIMQSCTLTNDSSCTTTDTYINLPGGMSLTLSPTHPDASKRIVYSVKNFHGDTALTVDSAGLPTSSVNLYEPFGQASPSKTFGTNSKPANATDQSMGWAADPARKSEGLFSIPIIQMGARVYLPTAGRFLQVDPVEGGTANAYTYVGDPINSNDYNGMFGWGNILNVVKKVFHVVTEFVKNAVQVIKKAVKAAVVVVQDVVNNYVKPAAAAVAGAVVGAVKTAGGAIAGAAKKTFEFVGKNSNYIGAYIGIVGIVACTVASAGLCGVGAMAVLAGASAVVSFIGSQYEGDSMGESLARGAVSGLINYVPFAGPGLKHVRWFGEGRDYKNMWTALSGGQGLINNQAIKRLGGQIWNGFAGYQTGAGLDSIE